MKTKAQPEPKKSQKQQILEHMIDHGSITAIEALNEFGCFRLAARINDLKKDGMRISTIMINSGHKSYASYKLIGN